MCVFIKSPINSFRKVSLALVTVFFITAIHTVMDPITKPSHRDTVGLIPASKLIFFTFCYTIHLYEHRHELCINEWEQQHACLRCQEGAAPDGNCPRTMLGVWLRENKFIHSKTCPESTETQNHGLSCLTVLNGCKQTLFALSVILRPKKFTKNHIRGRK